MHSGFVRQTIEISKILIYCSCFKVKSSMVFALNIFTHMWLSTRIEENNLKLHIFPFYGGILYRDARGGQDTKLAHRFEHQAIGHELTFLGAVTVNLLSSYSAPGPAKYALTPPCQMLCKQLYIGTSDSGVNDLLRKIMRKSQMGEIPSPEIIEIHQRTLDCLLLCPRGDM